MEIIPAIYILDGKTVALYKGDIEQTEIYRRSPIEYAKQFEAKGCDAIYIIDLDASEYGTDKNVEQIKQMRAAVKVQLICAGGIRTIDQVHEIFKMGIDKVVLGVAAESIYEQAIQLYGAEKVLVGIKAKGDEVITDTETRFPIRVVEFAEKLPEYGVKYVVIKDLWKESTMEGPNFDEVDRVLRMTDLKAYCSSGIGKEKHLDILKDIGTYGAIIGKAIYEKELYLDDLKTKYSESK